MESLKLKQEQQREARDGWEGRAPSPCLPTLAQNTQQQGAGAEQNIQDLLMLLYDGDDLLYQLCGPRQACGVHSAAEAQEELGCVTQTQHPEAAGSPLANPGG